MDCFAAVQWAYDNASTIGADSKQLAVGGDSAGAGIAAAVCFLARDRKGPKIAVQVLMYPMTQPTTLYGKPRHDDTAAETCCLFMCLSDCL